jgi:hypothetical protein
MLDFFTVIVSNDDGFSLGMSMLHEVKPAATVAMATVQAFMFFLSL